MWTLPFLIVASTVLLAIPLGLYMAWILDGRYRPPGWLRWLEQRADTGAQNWKQYAVALLAIIRGLRGDGHLGNFFLDIWRGVVYLFLPLAFVVAVLLMATGCPMTLDRAAEAATVEPGAMGTDDKGAAKTQEIARGPVA